MSVIRQKVGRTSKSVKNPEKRRVFATSELSGIHGNGFKSTFVVRVRDVIVPFGSVPAVANRSGYSEDRNRSECNEDIDYAACMRS